MSRRVQLVAAAILIASAASVRAADVATLVTLAVQTAIVELAADYTRSSGHQIRLSFDTGPNLARRLAANESADVLIAPAAVVDQAVRDQRVVPDSAVPIGRVAVGVAVRAGARVPDISSVDAFKRALLAADSVVYTQGTAGVYIEKLFSDLGISEAIRSKALRQANGADAMERIVTGRGNDIGFTMISEVRMFASRGAVLVGPLPGPIQHYTTYVAAVMTMSSDRAAAAGFVRHITTPTARRVFADAGWE